MNKWYSYIATTFQAFYVQDALAKSELEPNFSLPETAFEQKQDHVESPTDTARLAIDVCRYLSHGVVIAHLLRCRELAS